MISETRMQAYTIKFYTRELVHVATVAYSQSLGHLVIQLEAGAALGIGPHSVGLRWNQNTQTYDNDLEIVFDGAVSHVAPGQIGTLDTARVINVVNSIVFQDAAGNDCACLRWLAEADQAAAGRSYKRDVLELTSLRDDTGIVITGRSAGVPEGSVASSHAPIYYSGVYRRYPF